MKKLLTITFVLALLVGMLPAGVASAADGTVVKTLWAGKNVEVGTVTVETVGTELVVTYQITATGWYLTETHLYVGTAKPKMAPGLYPYSDDPLPFDTTTWTYTVPINLSKDYYIAAHAVVMDTNTIIGWDCPTLEEIAAALPASGTIKGRADTNGDSYFDVAVTSSKLTGTYNTWCIDKTHSIYLNTNYTANFYSSYEPLPDYLTTGTNPNIDKPENLDLVNWVINQGFIGQTGSGGVYTAANVQDAIWNLIDDNPPACNANCQSIVDAAYLNGDGFIPDFAAGDVIAIIVAPVEGAGFQTTIAQVTAFELGIGCIPIYGDETAWAKRPADMPEDIPWQTGWGSYFLYNPAD